LSAAGVTTVLAANAGINSLLIETDGDVVATGGGFNPSAGVGSVALVPNCKNQRIRL
jgi:hypothetical protein